jgi:hypothetical protein
MPQFTLTDHARRRLNARRIPLDAVDFVFRYGRELPSRGAVLHVLGRRELELFRKDGVNVDGYEGVHVVASEEGTVITAYKNRSPHRLRPRGGSGGRFDSSGWWSETGNHRVAA